MYQAFKDLDKMNDLKIMMKLICLIKFGSESVEFV
jgi:hypothetical protein